MMEWGGSERVRFDGMRVIISGWIEEHLFLFNPTYNRVDFHFICISLADTTISMNCFYTLFLLLFVYAMIHEKQRKKNYKRYERKRKIQLFSI